MVVLLSAGSACALVAFFICLHLKDGDRMKQSAALFATMLGLLLAQVFPEMGLVFGVLAILAAVIYAFLAFRSMRRDKKSSDDEG